MAKTACSNCGYDGEREIEEDKDTVLGFITYDKLLYICPECDHRDSVRRFF